MTFLLKKGTCRFILVLLCSLGFLGGCAPAELPTDSHSVDSPNCPDLYSWPRNVIDVQPAAAGIRTAATIYLSPDIKTDKQKDQLLLTLGKYDEKGNLMVLDEKPVSLQPSIGGVEVVFVIDVDPRFAVAGTRTNAYGTVEMNDPSYYFALIWQNILEQFKLTNIPGESDRGKVLLSAIGYQSDPKKRGRSELFEDVVVQMPRVARVGASSKFASADTDLMAALREDSDIPRMIFMMRWHETPFDEAQRLRIHEKVSNEATDAKHSRPIIVMDIDHTIAQSLVTSRIGKHDLYVVPYGPLPDLFPMPNRSKEWIPEEVGVQEDVKQTIGAVVRDVTSSISHRFEVDQTWSYVVSSEDAPKLRLRVTFDDADLAKHQRPRCDFELRFPTGTLDERSHERLTTRSFLMVVAAFLLSLFVIPALLVLMPVVERWLPTKDDAKPA